MLVFNQNNKCNNHNRIFDASFDIIYLESLLMLEEESSYIRNNLLEATHLGIIDKNPEILTEGFKDFVNNIKELLQKFINYIKTAIGKFFVYISSLSRDFKKFMDTHKDEILKKDISFKYEGFNYTIDDDVPNIDPIQDLIKKYNSTINDIKTKRVHEIRDEEVKFFSKLPELRANVLKVKKLDWNVSVVQDYEFNDICVKRFRGGFSEPITLTIDKSYIQKIVKEYSLLEKNLSATKKSYETVLAQLNNLKSFFEKRVIRLYDESEMKIKVQPLSNTSYTPENGDYLDYDTDVYETLNAFMDFSFKQVKVLGSLITTTFYEKINAINDNLKQYTEIFKQAAILTTGGY